MPTSSDISGRLAALALVFLASAGAVSSQQLSPGELEAKRITRPIAQLRPTKAACDFRVSGATGEAQAFFNQGLVQLHQLDATSADHAFFRVTELAPECAMAWWGLAVANVEKRVLARYYLSRAMALEGKASPRERQWMAALGGYLVEGTTEEDRRNHFVNALNRLATDDPEDDEAAAFLVRQLLDNREVGMPVPFVPAVDALISQVIRARPKHPIVLYRGLLWERTVPGRAVESLERAREMFADAPRALTWVGRGYIRQGDASKALACFSEALSQMRERAVAGHLALLDQRGYLESADLLIGQLWAAGHWEGALALARHLIELPAVGASQQEMEQMAAGTASFGPNVLEATVTGQRRLLEMLVTEQKWGEILSFERSGHLKSASIEIRGRRAHALGLGALAQGDVKGVEARVREIEQLGVELIHFPAGHGLNEKSRSLQALLKTLSMELASGTVAEGGRKVASRAETPAAKPALAAWTPEQAPPFSLPDQHGQKMDLTQFKDRPVLLVFYRGAGCPHCIEQLAALAPLHAKFEKAGVSVLGISTDTVVGLQASYKAVGAKTALPFPLISDHALEVFGEYGALDVRTREALHGLFLLDSRHRVIWQNIGVEPFMAVEPLLAEAVRTLPLWAISSGKPVAVSP